MTLAAVMLVRMMLTAFLKRTHRVRQRLSGLVENCLLSGIHSFSYWS